MDEPTTSSDSPKSELKSISMCSERNTEWFKRNDYGTFLYNKGYYNEAITCHLQNLYHSRNIVVDYKSELHSYNNLGICYRKMGKIDDALFYFLKSLELSKTKNDKPHICMSFYLLQETYYEKSIIIYKANGGQENDDSIDALASATNYCQDILIMDDYCIYESLMYKNLSIIYRRLKRYQDAINVYQKMLSIPSMQNDQDMMQTYNNLAEMYFNMKQYPDALIFYAKAQPLILKLNCEAMTMPGFYNLCEIYHHYGDISKAMDYIKSCLQLAKKYHNSNYQVKSYKSMIKLFKLMEKWEDAWKCAKQVLLLSILIRNDDDIQYAEKEIIYLGNYINHKWMNTNKSGDHNETLINCWTKFNEIGNHYFDSGEYDKALKIFNLNLNRSRESLNDRSFEATDLHNIGKTQCAIGEFDNAIENFESSLLIGNILSHNIIQEMSIYLIGYTYFMKAKKLSNYNQNGVYNKQITHALLLAAYYLLQLYDIPRRNLQDLINVYNALGEIFRTLGDYQQAIKFFKNQLSAAKIMNNKEMQIESLRAIGNGYSSLGLHNKAIKYNELSLILEINTEN